MSKNWTVSTVEKSQQRFIVDERYQTEGQKKFVNGENYSCEDLKFSFIKREIFASF